MGTSYQIEKGCPDLGPPTRALSIPIAGSAHTFPHCPVFSLREARLGMPAPFLLNGHHPATLVADDVADLEAGSVRSRDLAPLRLELARMMQRERFGSMKRDAEERAAARKGA